MAISIESAVRAYLERMVEIRSTGGATNETSFYSALENLLNEVGKTLDPNVICNGQLRNQGAGHPDFGLYSQKQCQKGAPKAGQGEMPERGVIEVKPLSDNTWQTARGTQAAKYFSKYRLVLVTNYRDFRLIGEDDSGKAVQREFFSFAPTEAAFWNVAAHPIKGAKEAGPRFGEILKRTLMSAAPLRKPEDVAWFLASYARDALTTLEEKDASALAPVREALELTLGIKFDGAKGEHFFRSTLIQTLFYGVFSAWVLWVKGGGVGKFDWRHAGYILIVPMVRALFEEIAKPSRLGPLGLIDILDRTGESLGRVDQTEFFKTFDTEQAVQHFYEPFLEAFDPELRRELGVWYTPLEIVRYMVGRVDTVLRTELKVADGLADKSVYVLDPCCGTGTFVVEVLRKIEETLRAKGDDPLIGQDVKEAALNRVFGFEILSAPFVIGHWQIGNLLSSLGAPLDASKDERASIYLTNALTGWQPAAGPKKTLAMFPSLEQERDQAERVKRDVPILVILGNPPYNAFAGTSPEEEQGLVEPYKEGLTSTWDIKKFNLDELYVRFLRIAERRIVGTGRGVVCYISSYSYLGDPSFVVARKRLLQEFDTIWIDSLNGDSRETGKLTPSGDPDPSVFSTAQNRAGIQLGTSVGLFVRTDKTDTKPKKRRVLYRDFWGQTKRAELLGSIGITPFDGQYVESHPADWNKHSLRPRAVDPRYLTWPKVSSLADIVPINGLMEKRGGALIDVSKANLAQTMKTYFDKSVSWSAFKLIDTPLAHDAARFDAKKARDTLVATEQFDDARIIRYFLRPFDIRHAYYSSVRPLWNEPRPPLWNQHKGGNRFLICRKAAVAMPEGAPFAFTRCLGDNDAMRGHAYYIPFRKHESLTGQKWPNLSKEAVQYVKSLGHDPNALEASADLIWFHALAIGYSSRYLKDNSDAVAIDWPRIPLPKDRTRLEASSLLGSELAALLDTENEVPLVTTGTVAKHLLVFGKISATDLAVTASWGRVDKQGKVFPGRGKQESRSWSPQEMEAIKEGLSTLGVVEARGMALLGNAVDVFLNEKTKWLGVPERVWEFYLGGYQVLKKWLSYREQPLLGRPLTKEEAREFTSTVRRLTAIVLMSDRLDTNYIAVRNVS